MKSEKHGYHGIIDRLRRATTEDLARLLPWTVIALIGFFIIFYFVLRPIEMSDQISFFLSSAIALFAFIEAFSTYIQVRLEKDRDKLQQVRDELQVYGPLYGIFNTKLEYKAARAFVPINAKEKRKIDNIFINYPFLIVPLTLSIWQDHIERLEPCKKETEPIFMIPMFFISHISLQYDYLTDEYHRRTGKEMLDEPSFIRRLKRFEIAK
jgi:hypothetical protein